jgi:hypothetical protein
MAIQIYNTQINKNVNLSQLQVEINTNANIIPSCLSISSSGNQYSFEFADSITTDNETSIETIITDHIPIETKLEITSLPISDLDGFKISVHSSAKPVVKDSTTYVVWTGAGDDLENYVEGCLTCSIGEGELLQFLMTPEVPYKSIDIAFNPVYGRVWINEGYLKFNGGGAGDFMNAVVVAEPTQLQQMANLDLIVTEDNWVKYSPLGPGTGTHGFASASKIVLVPRTFSKDGDWDYDGSNLTPNFTGTGGYKMSDIERTVHKYINKIPCYGKCDTYFSMHSDETTELPLNYRLRITAYNTSLTTWDASVILEIYRQATYMP